MLFEWWFKKGSMPCTPSPLDSGREVPLRLERVVGGGDVGAIKGVYTGNKPRLGHCGGQG